MENRQNSQYPTAQPPVEPLPDKKHLPPKIWVPILVAVGLIVTYLFAITLSPPAPPKAEIGGEEEGVDDLADWQTYRNEEFGFEFKYPRELDSESGLSFNLGDSRNILINIADASSEIGGIYKDSERNEDQILLNGRPAWQTKGHGTSNFYFIETYINNGQYIYHIQYSGPDENEEDINLLNQILSTFKFIEPVSYQGRVIISQGGDIIESLGNSEKQLNDEASVLMVPSPGLKNIVYKTNDQKIKLIEVETGKNSLVWSPGNDSQFITSFKWSLDDKIISWHLQDRDMHYIAFWNNNTDEVRYAVNPLDNYIEFHRINEYDLSPDGEFIAIMADIADQKGKISRYVVLYDILRGQSEILSNDDRLQIGELFFDTEGNVYYGLENSWLKYNIRTRRTDNFENKPEFWDKYKSAVFTVDESKMAYLCKSDNLCVADSKGGGGKVVVSNTSFQIIKAPDVYYYWTPEGKYLVFRGNPVDHEAVEEFWVVIDEGGEIYTLISR